MKPIKYETWVKLHEWIERGAKVVEPVAQYLFYEIPILGPLIGLGLARLLKWGLQDILDYLPHENEPRPDEIPLGKIRPPGFKYYVASPNMYGGDAERAQAASMEAQLNQPVSYGNPEEIAKAEKLIAEFKAKTGIKDITHMTPEELEQVKEHNEELKGLSVLPLTPIKPIKPMEPILGKWTLKEPRVYVKKIKGPDYYSPKAFGIVGTPVANPTWGRAGF